LNRIKKQEAQTHERSCLDSQQGKRLSAMLHLPDEPKKDTPIVICCHGFTGDKIGANQLTVNLAKTLESAGYIVLRYDFLGSGDSDGDFSSDTVVSGWKEDLFAVLLWVKRQPRFLDSPIILYGHSLGGLVVLTHSTLEQDIAGRIVFVPVIHPISNFRDIILGPDLWSKSLSGETIANFFAKGFKLEAQFVKELVEREYDPIGAAAKLATPLLIIHGLNDVAVPIQGSTELYQKYNGPKFFQKPNIDHVATGNCEVISQMALEWLSTEFPLR
jgi:alpha-beta hydrolase superfamily lysophospholipase